MAIEMEELNRWDTTNTECAVCGSSVVSWDQHLQWHNMLLEAFTMGDANFNNVAEEVVFVRKCLKDIADWGTNLTTQLDERFRLVGKYLLGRY